MHVKHHVTCHVTIHTALPQLHVHWRVPAPSLCKTLTSYRTANQSVALSSKPTISLLLSLSLSPGLFLIIHCCLCSTNCSLTSHAAPCPFEEHFQFCPLSFHLFSLLSVLPLGLGIQNVNVFKTKLEQCAKILL